MKKLILFIITLLLTFYIGNAQLSWQGGISPEDTNSATLLFDKTGTGLSSYSGVIYAHTGVTIDDTTQWQNVIGSWGNNTTQPALTLVSGNIYKLDLTPTIRDFYNYTGSGKITAINIVLRNADGSQQTTDFAISVGSFQVTLTNPEKNSTTILSSGNSLNITATNSNGNASYNLKSNGNSININPSTSNYTFNHTNITTNQNYQLEITQASTTIVKKFSVIVNPNTINQVIPAGMVEGINYNTSDLTKATLVIDAPLKDFIYVAGSFNNWQPNAMYAMKKDPSNTKFWLEITGLTPGQIETYQYWIIDQTPIANSPVFVKTADPFSTLVLSPFDDPGIPSNSYPNIPTYPSEQEREVTVLQTGQIPYTWQVPNFTKPKKEDLIIYELLIRDFDNNKNFQDVIDHIDYFKNLNINAIELLPVMEFEGNESWGYNTAFHMALDKFYGTENKLKELIDVCHQNGIAVILDLALNHAFGRNPMVRLWMDDPDGDGWGGPNSENPYFNQTAKHTYSVGYDFNHSNSFTKVYTKRVVKHWIEDFKIDGFRWDLTKGFTQNCTSGDQTCTNNYQQDRVDILKEYADYSWSLDETHYVIFEHLGSDTEEQEWANYRIGDTTPKGIMMWGEMWDTYKNLAQGESSNINFDRMGHTAHGFTEKRLLGYPESHDKDRIMYEMTTFGSNTEPSHNVRDLNTALKRMSALGAVTIPIPGPKMIWHFADLGMNNSIWTCSNGVVNSDYDGNNDGDCKLDTKPQPQWINNWLSDANRSQIYNDWSRLNKLKINEDVFEGNYSISSGTQTPRISIYTGNENTSGSTLKNVIIIANFSVTQKNINPLFPYAGTWYDLMDNSGNTTINGTTTSISLAPGEFKIFGNMASTLSTDSFEKNTSLKLFPNPVTNTFLINKNVKSVQVYSLTGKLVKEFKGSFAKGYAFNISNLPASIYLAKVSSDVENPTNFKIVKLN